MLVGVEEFPGDIEKKFAIVEIDRTLPLKNRPLGELQLISHEKSWAELPFEA